MKAALLITGSTPVQAFLLVGSPRLSSSGQYSVTKMLFSGENKNTAASSRSSLHLEIKDKKDDVASSTIRSVNSPERNFWEELKFSGGCAGNGNKVGGGNGGGGEGSCVSSTGGSSDRSKIGAYYQEMLKANPENPLLLRNYGRFLHEVENDVVRAEEYYGRAILTSPGDGEVLSLYGKLIWETHRDQDTAKSYFDQAVQASPDDCFVLGSYAHFLWDAEEDED